jgi:hypothetical protein
MAELPKGKGFADVDDDLKVYVTPRDKVQELFPYNRLDEFSALVDMGWGSYDLVDINWYKVTYEKTRKWSLDEIDAQYTSWLNWVELQKKPLKDNLTAFRNFLRDEFAKLEAHIREVDKYGHGDNSKWIVFNGLGFSQNFYEHVGYWRVERDTRTGRIVRPWSNKYQRAVPRRKLETLYAYSWEGYRRALSVVVTNWQRAIAAASRLTPGEIQKAYRKAVEKWYEEARASWKLPRTETHEEKLTGAEQAIRSFWVNRLPWIEWLGDLLAAEPVYASTGQAEPIYQTVTEVWDEYRNALIQQDPYFAWAVFTDGQTHKRMRMEKPPEKRKEWQKSVERVRQRSRTTYGRDLEWVETIISQRRETRPRSSEHDDQLPPER